MWVCLEDPFSALGSRTETPEGRFLVAMHDAEKCVMVRLKDEAYDGLILEVADKQKVAESLQNSARF